MSGSTPTEREIEVLRAYVMHGSTRAAGAALGISEQTVKNHLATIRHRLEVTTTLDALLVLRWVRFPEEWPPNE